MAESSRTFQPLNCRARAADSSILMSRAHCTITFTQIGACFAAAALFGAWASAQSFRGFQALSVVPPEPVSVEAGKEVVVPVTLRIRPGYHVNSNRPAEDYLIPTKLTWDAAPIALRSVSYPDAESVTYSFSEKPLSVYSGKIRVTSTFKAPESLGDGFKILSGSLRYQACNDKACLPPKTIAVKVAVLP